MEASVRDQHPANQIYINRRSQTRRGINYFPYHIYHITGLPPVAHHLGGGGRGGGGSG